jgi:lipopolysaccharide/colanic/teichoic acid biosynthesis glycosyltransferase
MFDVIIAALLLVALLPVLLMLALLCRLIFGSPVLFQQERPGFGGRVFCLNKFRSMSNVTDADGKLLPDALRLSRFGRVLRATSLDELPALLNVLRGEMSLVGPRPLSVKYLTLYSPEQARRHEVRPGITGLAQVNGRNAIAWEDRFRYDVWYVDNHSLRIDLNILVRTVVRVLARRDVAAGGSAEVESFLGTPRSDGFNGARTQEFI